MIDCDSCDHSLASSGDTWAEECSLALIDPMCEFTRIQKPLSGAFLPTLYDTRLLSGVVRGRYPVQKSAVLCRILVLLNRVYPRLDNRYMLPNKVRVIFKISREVAWICKLCCSAVLMWKLTNDPYSTRPKYASSAALSDSKLQ